MLGVTLAARFGRTLRGGRFEEGRRVGWSLFEVSNPGKCRIELSEGSVELALERSNLLALCGILGAEVQNFVRQRHAARLP
jgi:hypothetical protein